MCEADAITDRLEERSNAIDKRSWIELKLCSKLCSKPTRTLTLPHICVSKQRMSCSQMSYGSQLDGEQWGDLPGSQSGQSSF